MMTDLSSLNKEKLVACLPRHLKLNPRDDLLSSIHSSMMFLAGFDPLELDGEELEVSIMHAAYLVDPNNHFNNNMNIDPARRDRFIEHVDLMKSSDIDVWVRKLYDSCFWKFSNSTIANVLYNWLSRTLDNPRSFI